MIFFSGASRGLLWIILVLVGTGGGAQVFGFYSFHLNMFTTLKFGRPICKAVNINVQHTEYCILTNRPIGKI